jgi:hypothetical protein
VVRRIQGLVDAAEAEHRDDELRQLLRSLVPDFHPHSSAPQIALIESEPKELTAVRGKEGRPRS